MSKGVHTLLFYLIKEKMTHDANKIYKSREDIILSRDDLS